MYITHTVPSDYQGIDQLGIGNAGMLMHSLIRAIKSTLFFFVQWNFILYGFTPYCILGILFLIFAGIGFCIAVVKSGILKRLWATVLLVLCLLAIAPFAGIWFFTSESVFYRLMMLQSLVLVFVLFAQLYERWANALAKNVMALLLTAIIFNNALIANISYFYMNLTYERSYAMGAEMMLRIHEIQEEHAVTKIACVGSNWNCEYNDPESLPWRILTFEGSLFQTLFPTSGHITRFLIATFGLDLEYTPASVRNALAETPEVQALGCWPARDSLTVIDDILVIKVYE